MPSSQEADRSFQSFEQWQADGGKDIKTRALEKARRLLADYEKPELDPAVDEALQAFIDKRQRELPENEL